MFLFLVVGLWVLSFEWVVGFYYFCKMRWRSGGVLFCGVGKKGNPIHCKLCKWSPTFFYFKRNVIWCSSSMSAGGVWFWWGNRQRKWIDRYVFILPLCVQSWVPSCFWENLIIEAVALVRSFVQHMTILEVFTGLKSRYVP